MSREKLLHKNLLRF